MSGANLRGVEGCVEYTLGTTRREKFNSFRSNSNALIFNLEKPNYRMELLTLLTSTK